MRGAPSVIKTPDQRLRVFVSSTLAELADERLAATKAIESLRLIPVLFELGARPHPPRDLYRSYLAQSHIFVGIYWQSYGWVAPDEDVSGLEDEYRLAGDMPKLIYVKAAESRQPRLQELLDRIQNDDKVSYKHFTSGAELQALIQDDLALILTERFERAGSGAPFEEPEVRTVAAAGPPIPPTPFVGREREVEEVKALLGREDVRLLTLTGPGGIGKSRLAFEVAADVADDFRNGMGFVLLSSVNAPELAVSAIAQALGVSESAERSVLENVEEYLRDKEMLLLLDNFEHVVVAGPALSELLSACPGLKLLITSRAVLRLRNEYEYIVPSLGVPEPGDATDSLAESDAVRLFVERAQAAQPRFALSDDNASVVAEICRRLDGLPLAIELAAARSRLLPPQAMLERLENRFQLLTGGPRDLPERQQTMRATLDWDFELLTEDEQSVFKQMAVFAGGFTLISLERVVLSASPIDLLEVVESLVSKSLLRPVIPYPGEARFTFLRTIREYALEKLEDAGEVVPARHRHAEAFLDLAEYGSARLRESDQVWWLEILEREHDNLRAALRWLAANTDAERHLRMAGALAPFWEFRSHLSEGQRWMEQALTRAADVSPACRAKCLEGAGVLARSQGEYKRAAALIEECIALRREGGDLDGLASALKNLGIVAADRGDIDAARVLYEESLDLRKQTGDGRGIAEAQNNLGVVAGVKGDWVTAASYYEEALAYFRDRGDRHGMGRVLLNLGEARFEQGDFEAAGELAKESIRLCREIGSRWDLCDLLEEMGSIVNGKGRAEDGARLYGAAEALRELLGAPLPTSEVDLYNRRLDQIRDALDARAFEAAWAEGLDMDVDDAVDLALRS